MMFSVEVENSAELKLILGRR